MQTNLLTYLSQIPDPRRAASRRHPLAPLLAMVVLGHLSGCYAYRELARFMVRHAWTFVNLFDLKHGVPNHVTIGTVLSTIDCSALQTQFEAWVAAQALTEQASEQACIQASEPVAYALDGKSLRSTLSDYKQVYQDFVASVHLYAHQSGLVHACQSYHNGQQSEAHTVRELISRLDLKGAILTLDALHCQKKH